MSNEYWDKPRSVRMKSYSIRTFDGNSTVYDDGYTCYKCVAIISIRGEKTDHDFTGLKIGFTADPNELADPYFVRAEQQGSGYAEGCMTVLANSLAAYLSVLKEKEVYIVIGGNGTSNGVYAGSDGFMENESEGGREREIKIVKSDESAKKST